MAVYGGSLWLTGGDIGGNEVWRSADGRQWERVRIAGQAFSWRQEHQLVAHSVAFAYEVADISVTPPGGADDFLRMRRRAGEVGDAEDDGGGAGRQGLGWRRMSRGRWRWG